jgi:hypothetical protein
MSVRDHLVRALEADLVGPFDPHMPNEVLPIPPSRWYLTGFLVPASGRASDQDEPEDDEASAGDDEDDVETGGDDPAPKPRVLMPSSVGVSVLLPPGATTDELDVELAWAEYSRKELPAEGKKRPKRAFERRPAQRETVKLALDQKIVQAGVAVGRTKGLKLLGKLESMPEHGELKRGTRALSLFFVNERAIEDETDKVEREEKSVFQVSMTLRFPAGILARPNRTAESATDFDDRVSDLQFRAKCEHGVGHGVAVEAAGEEKNGRVEAVRIAWLPQAIVRQVTANEDVPVETRMEQLDTIADSGDLRAALSPLLDAYAAWIAEQRKAKLDGERRNTRDELTKLAEHALGRMRAGLARIASDAEARTAFRLMNRAMAMQSRRLRPDVEPRWRMFQLAFILQSVEGVFDDRHADRRVVDLIFFPTGGGKTEAYLGVIAFALVLRRLRGRKRPDGGLGVAALLRYTLRLLTLDQLGRAARLMCALELIRRADVAALGDVRFSIGLWVGRTATANTFAEVKRKVEEYRASTAKRPRSPFPLTKCPWCDTPLGKESFRLTPKDKPSDVIVSCLNRRECVFAESQSPEGLPVLFVDEQIYAELPCFVLATVDKFAMLPWRGETGLLFGRALARKERRFYGPMQQPAKGATPLPDGLLPPELIVQDELHLISGPLGTMVGLYETAIESLATRDVFGKLRTPKIFASTATVRRAREQVRALFGRPTALFPPQGVDEGETFFAKVDTTAPGRLYLGVAASGRPLKQILIRTYIALLGAAAHDYEEKGIPRQPADGYMTVTGYFNSLRELGGMRRLVDDDVRWRLEVIEDRKPVGHAGAHPWFRKRLLRETVELTSREQTTRIAESKARLESPWASDGSVDVLLASNMISVGVDIERLGVMVVAGQPKTTSEYIQASSRVGRSKDWPGLVVTCFNMAKPRDRSHYERFGTYHDSYYRFVEAQSLTPFSAPALERGLAGTLVGMARLGDVHLTPPEGAMDIGAYKTFATQCADFIADRAEGFREMSAGESARLKAEVRSRARSLLDAWQTIATAARSGQGKRAYSRYDRDKAAGKPILFTILDDDATAKSPEERLFAAPTSMRDVEPTSHLWVERRTLGGR